MPAPQDSPTRATVGRILDAAGRLVGQRGLEATTLADVARAAEVSVGLLRYHFRSREHLVIEAQRTTFRGIHARFEERFARGETGVDTALRVLDALWGALRDVREEASFLVATMALASKDAALRARLDDFNAEAVARVELGLVRVFEGRVTELPIPPERLAHAVRAGLYGLLVELAAARTVEDLAAVDRLYADVRGMLALVLTADAARAGGGPVH